MLGETAKPRILRICLTQDAVVLPSLSKPWAPRICRARVSSLLLGVASRRSRSFRRRARHGHSQPGLMPRCSVADRAASCATCHVGSARPAHSMRWFRRWIGACRSRTRRASLDRFVSPALPFVPPTESRQKIEQNRPAAYRPPVSPAAVPASNQQFDKLGRYLLHLGWRLGRFRRRRV